MFAVAIASSVYSGAEKQNPPKEIGVILTTANIAIQFQPEEMDCMRVEMRVVLVSGGWNQGTGSHPTLPNRGKMRVKAVVPYAAFSDQMDRRIVTMMKQKHRPPEQIVRNDRPPKRFMSETGIAEPTRSDRALIANAAIAQRHSFPFQIFYLDKKSFSASRVVNKCGVRLAGSRLYV
ncbi:hypothetical protein BGZ61DRAFT_483824 [Ilyonectria robusta]|uniref:uncharacterized protein n=1 Tax=Ilyonectria robusta TaxID=1079257 RepID=UPI001E8DA4A5|nr:uncharacterized protein BGZ61DRAFT_483824 [Ilyonectria robusta]KAH8667128.1 hypothetical protein BGZ61DRAFT_483824 [Ilyonectria robusta]